MTWARDGYLIVEAGAVSMYEVDYSGEKADEIYGHFIPVEPDALSIFLVERQGVVEYTLFDPTGGSVSGDLDGTYVSANDGMMIIGNGFFYLYDSVDWDEVTWMQDGYLEETPGCVNLWVSDLRGEDPDSLFGRLVPMSPGVVTLEVPEGNVPVVFVRDETGEPKAPTIVGFWNIYSDPNATDAPAAFEFTEDGYWSAYDYMDHEGYSVRQFGPYSTGLWGLADGGPDYRAFSLYMESKSDYITGMQMYYDVDGVLYLTFYDGMTYTKSPED